MFLFNKKSLLVLSLIVSTNVMANPSENGSQASEHTSKAVGYSTKAGGQVVSAAVAVPVISVAAVGLTAASVGAELVDSASGANNRHPTKLVISPVTIVAAPAPADVMKTKQTNSTKAEDEECQ